MPIAITTISTSTAGIISWKIMSIASPPSHRAHAAGKPPPPTRGVFRKFRGWGGEDSLCDFPGVSDPPPPPQLQTLLQQPFLRRHHGQRARDPVHHQHLRALLDRQPLS